MDPAEQSQHSNNQFSNKVLNSMTIKGTLSGQKLKKRQGIFGIFGGKVSVNCIVIC